MPDFGAARDAVVAFTQAHEAWAPAIVFALAFAESLAFLSLLVPSTVILLGIGALVGASGITLGPLWLAGGLGASLGYSASYWIGAHFKDRVPGLWPFRTHPEALARTEAFFARYGALGVFFGHFFGPVRAVIPVVAGMAGMAQLPFQIANLASAFIWATLILIPGVATGGFSALRNLF